MVESDEPKKNDELTGREKAAILLISLDKERAAEILRTMDKKEVEILTKEITKWETVPPELIKQVWKEFYQLTLTSSYLNQGGKKYAEEILSRALGNHKALDVMDNFRENPNATYYLDLSVEPVDGGSISLNPPAGVYENGTIVTVTAAANTGYKFDHWSGDISGSDLSKEVTIDSDKTVVAHFSKVIGGYTLDTSVNPTGSGSITLSPSGGIYEGGSVVTITAVPASGFVFDHWEGSVSGISSSVQITMDSNKTVTAVFNDSNTPSLSVSINKPESSSLYIRDRKLPMELKRLVTPIVIGKMTIDVKVENAVGDVTVEFYVDDVLKMNVTRGDSSFSWTWDERAFFRHTIKVVACDQGDNSGEASIEVFIFHL